MNFDDVMIILNQDKKVRQAQGLPRNDVEGYKAERAKNLRRGKK